MNVPSFLNTLEHQHPMTGAVACAAHRHLFNAAQVEMKLLQTQPAKISRPSKLQGPVLPRCLGVW